MSNSPGGVTPQPPSLEKRLPIALALMMLVLLASQYIFKPAPGAKPVTPINDKTAANLVQKPATAAQAVPPAANAAAGAIQASSEITTDIDTELYRIIFTNKGAVIKSWVLKHYQDNTGKPLELIDTAARNVPLPFSIETAQGQKLSVDPNAVLYQAKVSPNKDGITYLPPMRSEFYLLLTRLKSYHTPRTPTGQTKCVRRGPGKLG
jgi:YidC/Oxa1 family membrane protein insertase